MARIDWVEDDQAEGLIGEIYAEWKQANPHRPKMPEILKCFSQRPDILRPLLHYTYGLHFADGCLDRRTKEMIATYVSALNRCEY
jgi:alkylhydroperoxidase/carboxymuconolactone decarboxylase family protein YurZ